MSTEGGNVTDPVVETENPKTSEDSNSSKIQKRNNKTALLFIVILILASFAVYARSLGFRFVYDDRGQIVHNSQITSWKNLPSFFTQHVWAHIMPDLPVYYRPIFSTWLLINYYMFGLDAFWWHLSTIFLHIFATVLVFRLISKITCDDTTAFITGLIFGVHPLHIESVTWISGCTEPILAIFFLGSFLFYLKSREGHRKLWFCLSLFSFMIAIFSKETAVVLPGLILVHSLIYDEKWKLLLKRNDPADGEHYLSRLWKLSSPVLAYVPLIAIYLIARYYAMGQLTTRMSDVTLKTIILTWPSILWFYLSKLVWPLELTVFYYFPYCDSPLSSRFLIPLLALAAAGLILGIWQKRNGMVRIGLAWLLFPIIPTLNFAVFYRGELAHDRYMYLPTIGFGLLIALAIRSVGGSSNWKGLPVRQIGIALIISLLFGISTLVQSGYWFTEKRLLMRGVELVPESFIARSNLGNIYQEEGDLDTAIELYSQAIKLYPEHWFSNYNLGFAYFQKGRYQEAESRLRLAIQLKPNSPQQYVILGAVLIELNRYDEAEEPVRKALSLYPRLPGANYALSQIFEKKGRFEEAIRAAKEEMVLYPPGSGKRLELLSRIEELKKKSNPSNNTAPTK